MRNLDQLRERYNSASSKAGGPMGGPPMGGPGPRGRHPGGMKGKPKNLKKTVSRLLSYVKVYKLRLFAVLFAVGAFVFLQNIFSFCAQIIAFSRAM